MTNLKSSHKVISFILTIALVLTMFVTVAPTNVMATGASGNVGESGTVGESGADPIRINIENLQTGLAQTSPYATKKPYEFFIVGEALPNITTADFTVAGEGSENVTATEVKILVWNGTEYVTATGTVEAGKWYKISCFYKANDGYQLYYGGYEQDAFAISVYTYACVNSNKEIVAVNSSDFRYQKAFFPTFEAGVAIPTISNVGNKAVYTLNANYYPYAFSENAVKFLEFSKIENGITYWEDVTTTTFVAGKRYTFMPILEAKDGYTFNYTDDFVENADGTLSVIWEFGVCPAKTSNDLNGQLVNPPAITSVTDLTDSEQTDVNNGAIPKLDLDVKTVTPPAADKTATESIVSSEKLTVAQYLDIDLNLVMGDYTRALTDLKAPITVQITVPAGYRSINRDFYIIRVHDGVATKITPKSYNQYTGVLTFETDKFSTYALAYQDKTVVTPTTPVIVGGAPMGTTAHIHSFKYNFNKDTHWSNCSCGMATSEEKHNFNTNGVCTVCDYNKNDKTQSSAPVANPSTGGNSSAVFIFAILSVLLVFGTTNAIARKKHSK